MRILISNDDGYLAPGLAAVEAALDDAVRQAVDQTIAAAQGVPKATIGTRWCIDSRSGTQKPSCCERHTNTSAAR